MHDWLGEGFSWIIGGMLIAGILLLILVLFIAPSVETGLPQVYELFVNGFSR